MIRAIIEIMIKIGNIYSIIHHNNENNKEDKNHQNNVRAMIMEIK